MLEYIKKCLYLGASAILICTAFSICADQDFGAIIESSSTSPEAVNFGSVPCSLAVGDPVSAITGNLHYEITDIIIDSDFDRKLEFTRCYNSGGFDREQETGLGPRWTHSLSTRIIEDSLGWITLMESTGRYTFFRDFRPPTDLAYRLEYDSNTSRYTVIMPENEVLLFRPDGLLSEIRDRDYTRIKLSYEDGKLARATDASGRYLDFSYNAAGRIHSISLADGSTYLTYDYDADHRNIVSKVTYADGSGESYEYGEVPRATGLMIKRCTSDGVCQHYRYDNSTRVTTNYGNDSVNFVSLFFYKHTRGGKTYYGTTVKDDDTVFYESEFSGNTGRRKLISKISISDFMNTDDNQERTFGYDSSGREVASRIGEEIIDTLEYDSLGRQAYSWNRLDRTGLGEYSSRTYRSSRYNQEDDVKTTWNDSYDTTSLKFEYDEYGNITSIYQILMSGISDNIAGRLKMKYNDRGQITYFDGPDPGEIDAVNYSYHKNGDLKYIASSCGDKREHGRRDIIGNPTWVKDFDGARYDFHYDQRGRPTSIRYCPPDGECETISQRYNFAGDITRIEYPDGSATDYIYDNHGWLVEIDDTVTGQTHYSYDSYGNVQKILRITPEGDTLTESQSQTR